MPSIDFSNVKGLDPIPQGSYTAEIVHAEAGVSQSGNPKIELRYKVVGGDYDGRLVFDSLSFHPDALWRTKLNLTALGFPKDFSGDIEPSDLIGRQAVLSVTIEESRGNDADGEPYPPRNRIVKVKPVGATASSVL